MTNQEISIKKAGLFPTFEQLESFAKNLEAAQSKKSALSQICKNFVRVAQFEDLYFIQKFSEFCDVTI